MRKSEPFSFGKLRKLTHLPPWFSLLMYLVCKIILCILKKLLLKKVFTFVELFITVINKYKPNKKTGDKKYFRFIFPEECQEKQGKVIKLNRSIKAKVKVSPEMHRNFVKIFLVNFPYRISTLKSFCQHNTL